ncbi:3073_t:CDS:2 [Cetraspora pellucida]|uniref:3073_t:CDS:1 n=1 Tax=Cetraspora pellucida TaxID=1433469 RepID=A0A9N9FYZ2_9GLOM|nr:3073_t:CDS:2 [Cetraspora pellucida]
MILPAIIQMRLSNELKVLEAIQKEGHNGVEEGNNFFVEEQGPLFSAV